MLINLGQKISSDKWGQVAASFLLSNSVAEQTHSCTSSGWVEGGASRMRLAALPLCFTLGAACQGLDEDPCYFCTEHPVFPSSLPLGCCFDSFFGFLFLPQKPEKMFICCSSAGDFGGAMSCLHTPAYRTAWLGMAQLFLGGKVSPGLLLKLSSLCAKQSSLVLIGQVWG